jgi:transposase
MATPKAVRIELSEGERAELQARLRRRKVARGDALRAEIVLLAAEGLSNLAITERLGIARMTVATWRRRFAERRMDGLVEDPRPGAPRTVTDEKVAEVVTATLESLPAGRTHWSSRGMAKAAGLAPSTVQRIWKAFSLQPQGSPHSGRTLGAMNEPGGWCLVAEKNRAEPMLVLF